MIPVWGISKSMLRTIQAEAIKNLEAVINRLLRFDTEEMDALAEYLFDIYA